MNELILSGDEKSVLLQSLKRYRSIIGYRDDRLFTRFLPQGYACTMLSAVDNQCREQVMSAKCHLGMLITLLDDFADHPQHYNSILLNEIYKIPLDRQNVNHEKLSPSELSVLQLADYLLAAIHSSLLELPHYAYLKQILQFDLQQFYQANRYSSLITSLPCLLNTDELIRLRPFNMGMVMAGMIDIAGSSTFNFSELGAARHVLHLGQRFGSLCNNLNTFSRELNEGDMTNELIAKAIERRLITQDDCHHLSEESLAQKLTHLRLECEEEMGDIHVELAQYQQTIQSFSCKQYITGLVQLRALHEAMQGVI